MVSELYWLYIGFAITLHWSIRKSALEDPEEEGKEEERERDERKEKRSADVCGMARCSALWCHSSIRSNVVWKDLFGFPGGRGLSRDK